MSCGSLCGVSAAKEGREGVCVNYLGFHRKAQIIKSKLFLVTKRGWHGPRHSLHRPWKLERRDRQPCYYGLVLHKQHNLQNTVFCEDHFAKIHLLCAHLTYKHTHRMWYAHTKMMLSVFTMGCQSMNLLLEM